MKSCVKGFEPKIIIPLLKFKKQLYIFMYGPKFYYKNLRFFFLFRYY